MQPSAPVTIVVDDQGYNDNRLFAKWTGFGIYFVTRMKDNTLFEGVEEHAVPKNWSILKDQTIRQGSLAVFQNAQAEPENQNLLRHLGQRRQDADLDSTDLDIAAALLATVLLLRLELVQSRRAPAHQSFHPL